MDSTDNHETASLTRWLSLGHGKEYAISAALLEDTLVAGIAKLTGAPQPLILDVTGGLLPPGAMAMPRDDPLLPLWTRFAKALSTHHGGDATSIDLHISHSRLSAEVVRILEPVLATAPLDYWMLSHNRLGPEGLWFVVRVLEANPLVRYLVFANNPVQSTDDLLSLVRAATEHPTLKYFNVEACGIGPTLMSVPCIVPHLFQLHTVNLASNKIGSTGAAGAAIVSACLVANPAIKILVLNDNLFDDEDATLFAMSLKINKNLLEFDLCRNAFTRAGIDTLLRATFDDTSLNAIRDSNHTCRLKLSANGNAALRPGDEDVLAINDHMFRVDAFPEEFRTRCARWARDDLDALAAHMLAYGRARVKTRRAFWRDRGADGHLAYLAGLPQELVPAALAVFQDCGRYAGTGECDLATVFVVVRASPSALSFHGAGVREVCVRVCQETGSTIVTPQRKRMLLPKACPWKCFGTTLESLQRRGVLMF